jgi:probable rRNA maturation factor
MTIFVADEQSEILVDLPRWVRLARLTMTEERAPVDSELSLTFVDEATIAGLNKRFRGVSGPTDVLAFPMDDEQLFVDPRPELAGRAPPSQTEALDAEPPVVLGDVVICPVVAARQAPDHAITVDDELALLVVHGVLHLLNYDHALEPEAEKMQQRERELLARFRQLES